MAIFAIGDIQGCYDPFARLLEHIRFDPEEDRLWIVGDLVNRGPKSLKTLRFVKSLGKSAVTVLGNHDLHLLALAYDVIENGRRFDTLTKTLNAPDVEELMDWLRRRPLAHYDKDLDTLLVHAGTLPAWSIEKTMKRAAEVESVLRDDDCERLLYKMYGNQPSKWSGKLTGYNRLRFIINVFTRMRMLTLDGRLRMAFSGAPWRSRGKVKPWFEFADNKWGDTRIVFGHWSQLGVIVLPKLVSLDSGCVWGRQLTAVRLDKPEIFQVEGQK